MVSTKDCERSFNMMEFGDWKDDDPFVKADIDVISGKFGKKFFELLTLISKHDPIGIIIYSNMVKSEYTPEAKTIIMQLDKCTTKIEIHKLVHGEFVRWFGDSDKLYENLKPLADDIFEWKTNLNRNLLQEYCETADSLTREFVNNKEHRFSCP